MKKFLSGTIILFFIPFVTFAQFDQSNYLTADIASFTSDSNSQEYIWIWNQSYDHNYGMVCTVGAPDDTEQVFPQGGVANCDFQENSNDTEDGTRTGTGVAGSVIFEDLEDGTYLWIEPDGFDACVDGVDTYDTCLAQGNYVAFGSFTLNEIIEEFERIGTGFYFFGETNDSAEEQTTEQLATAVQTNINSGVWQTTLLAISVFLAFYILQKIIMFFGYAYRKTNKIKIKK